MTLITALLVATTAWATTVDEQLFSGAKFIEQKKYKEAVREFEVAVALEPDNARANLLLGLTLANTGELERATKFSLKAVQLESSYSGYYNLALIYSNQEKYDQAVDAYNEALKLTPKSYQAWHQLGKVHATMLNFDKAVESYQKAALLNPKFPDAYQGLGSAFYWSGNLTGSLQQVDELNRLGFSEKAAELEGWIKDKEIKKKKAAAKAGSRPPA